MRCKREAKLPNTGMLGADSSSAPVQAHRSLVVGTEIRHPGRRGLAPTTKDRFGAAGPLLLSASSRSTAGASVFLSAGPWADAVRPLTLGRRWRGFLRQHTAGERHEENGATEPAAGCRGSDPPLERRGNPRSQRRRKRQETGDSRAARRARKFHVRHQGKLLSLNAGSGGMVPSHAALRP